MNKIIFISQLIPADAIAIMAEKAGYETLSISDLDSIPSLCVSDSSIHALIIDAEAVNPAFIGAVRASVKDGLFPVIIITKNADSAEIGKWIESGVSDVFTLPMPFALMNRRIATAVQLFCMSRSLKNQSFDSLTGLLTRNAFYHFAEKEIRENPDSQFSVIISDIEHFKRINELFGYEKGDELLAYVGKTLSAMSADNTVYARYDGDRFACLLRMPKGFAGFSDMSPVEESMKMLYKHAPIDRFTVKFGIYNNIDTSLPVATACDRAIMALNTIKGQYGSTVAAYSPQLQQRYYREQRIIDSMERALEEGQFSVYYQPKHSIRTSEITGVEALVRWQHPDFGFMSPGEFIPMFERNGFISQLDKYVWNRVCRDLRSWMDDGLKPIPVSVNVSRKDFLHSAFFESLEAPMKEYGITSDLFHIEVTESIYMEDEKILTPIISKIREMGVLIELDDFGSGFSSLGILSNLPLDIIKLDIGIVRNLEEHPLMVESIVRMMHNLGYTVTAEGVETAAQLELLGKMDCDDVQGYYFSRPLTFSGLKEYVYSYSENL